MMASFAIHESPTRWRTFFAGGAGPANSTRRKRNPVRLNLFGLIRAARRSFPLRLQPAKQTARGFTNRLCSLLGFVAFHERNLARNFEHGLQRKSASGAFDE